jgi:hypothetical protein
MDGELFAQLEADVHAVWARQLTVCNLIQSDLAALKTQIKQIANAISAHHNATQANILRLHIYMTKLTIIYC